MAHTLHVGEMSIPLHTTKYTTPSVNFLIDGDVWYLPMVKVEQQNTLHLSYKNDVYTVCRGAERKVGNHYFVGDCLVGVDDNVYLESTGTMQYIDTGVFVRATDTIGFTIDGIFYNDMGPFNGSNNFNQIVTDGIIYRVTRTSGYTPETEIRIGNRDIVSSNWDGKTQIDTLLVNNVLVETFNLPSDRSNNICIFVICDNGIPLGNHNSAHVRVYSAKVIRDNSMLIRHMIPVPAGLQIGNFTVPSNGMWDIVEQKFYGNSGTGDFVYGVDE